MPVPQAGLAAGGDRFAEDADVLQNPTPRAAGVGVIGQPFVTPGVEPLILGGTKNRIARMPTQPLKWFLI